MKGSGAPEARVAEVGFDCSECGQPGHSGPDCANAFVVLRGYDRADWVRTARSAACRHGERLASCLAVSCRDELYAIRNPAGPSDRALPSLAVVTGARDSRRTPPMPEVEHQGRDGLR